MRRGPVLLCEEASDGLDPVQGVIPPAGLGDVDPRRDHVGDGALGVDQARVLPCDEPWNARARDPMVLVRVGERPSLEVGHGVPHILDLRGRDHDIPDRSPHDLGSAVAAEALAGAVEADDPSLRVEDHHERARDVEDGVDEALLVGQALQCFDRRADVAADRDGADESALCDDRLHRRPATWTTPGRLVGRSRPAFATDGHSRLCGALPLARPRSRVVPAPVTHAPAT